MNEDDSNNHAELVPVERALALTSLADNRIVSEMVADSLVLARDSAPAPVDLDALVREAERLRCSKGGGMTEENIRAFKLFSRAAEAGHSEAQVYLGQCYNYGLGVPQDYFEAVKWYRKAAEQGDARAQWHLGSCYHYGQGVPIDILQEYKWFKLAGDQGNELVEATALAFLMSPSELESAYKLYREFKDQHPAKEHLADAKAIGPSGG